MAAHSAWCGWHCCTRERCTRALSTMPAAPCARCSTARAHGQPASSRLPCSGPPTLSSSTTAMARAPSRLTTASNGRHASRASTRRVAYCAPPAPRVGVACLRRRRRARASRRLDLSCTLRRAVAGGACRRGGTRRVSMDSKTPGDGRLTMRCCFRRALRGTSSTPRASRPTVSPRCSTARAVWAALLLGAGAGLASQASQGAWHQQRVGGVRRWTSPPLLQTGDAQRAEGYNHTEHARRRRALHAGVG